MLLYKKTFSQGKENGITGFNNYSNKVLNILKSLVKRCTAIADDRVQMPYKIDFFGVSFRNCKICFYNCDEILLFTFTNNE